MKIDENLNIFIIFLQKTKYVILLYFFVQVYFLFCSIRKVKNNSGKEQTCIDFADISSVLLERVPWAKSENRSKIKTRDHSFLLKNSLFQSRKSRTHRSRALSFSFRSERAPFVLISNTADAIDRVDFSFHFERAPFVLVKKLTCHIDRHPRALFLPFIYAGRTIVLVSENQEYTHADIRFAFRPIYLC